MRILRPAALIFLLILAFGAPGAFASPARTTAHPARQQAAGRQGLVQQLRAFLVHLWSPEGCSIDPLGRTSCQPVGNATPRQVAAADDGCEIDPLGRCAAQR